jgi:eukaryotic-like serine/threonine-protein kinase
VRDLIGRKLGPYEIRDVIGHGGMATVYRAYQPALNRFVAIKVLNTSMGQDAEFVARFLQEALAAGGLDHPNILHIYDADVFEDRQYIVMAYAPGGTLADRLRKGRLSYDDAADMAAQIAEALNYAHRRDIVHRDIKPSNILLDEEDRPLLADFGIAQAVSSGRHLTQTGSSIGTPGYMSPEQAEGRRVDGRSDLFSLGIVLYQMATGKMPFQADTSMAVMFQVVHQTPPPPRSVNPAIPLYLDSVIQKALAKQPDARFQTGQEMAQALRQRRVVVVPPPSEEWDRVTLGMPSVPGRQRVTPMRQTAALPRKRSAGRGVLIALLVLALAAMLGAGGYLARDALSAHLVQGVTAMPTQVAQASPPEAATVPPTEVVQPSPTRGAGGVVVATAAVPAEIPVPTQTPVIVVVTVLAPAPTVVPTAQPTQTVVPTDTPQPAPTVTAAATKPLTATKTPGVTKNPPITPPPGIVLDFEQFGAWRRGNEPYGNFVQSSEQKHAGNYSGKLAYQFPAVKENYVVFTRNPPKLIPGQPAALKLWVYGDGSGHFLNAWVRDHQNEVRQFTFGQITHTGWQDMTAPLDTAAAWPQTHISGTDNGRLDFPISLDSLVLDGVPDGGGPFLGAIYVDDLGTGDVTAPQAAAPAPAANTAPAAAPAAPPAASSPPVGLSGHIVYTSGTGGATGIWALDVTNRNTWEVHSNARQADILGDGRVVFNGIGGGKDNIFSVNLDGSYERMNSLHPEDSHPSWSPTGVSAAIHSTLQGDGKERIYVLWDMSTAREPKILQNSKTDIYGKYPTWLETWRIAFSGCDYWAGGGNCGIWTVNSNGSGAPTQLTTNPADISTDSAGGILLFASPRIGNWDVYAMPEGGGTPQNLTNHPSQDTGGTFSPDGRYIAFMSNRDGGWGIWVMNADGSNPQKLLAVPGFGANWIEERLAWGP